MRWKINRSNANNVFAVIFDTISLQNNAAFHNFIQRVRAPLLHDSCFSSSHRNGVKRFLKPCDICHVYGAFRLFQGVIQDFLPCFFVMVESWMLRRKKYACKNSPAA